VLPSLLSRPVAPPVCTPAVARDVRGTATADDPSFAHGVTLLRADTDGGDAALREDARGRLAAALAALRGGGGGASTEKNKKDGDSGDVTQHDADRAIERSARPIVSSLAGGVTAA